MIIQTFLKESLIKEIKKNSFTKRIVFYAQVLFLKENVKKV